MHLLCILAIEQTNVLVNCTQLLSPLSTCSSSGRKMSQCLPQAIQWLVLFHAQELLHLDIWLFLEKKYNKKTLWFTFLVSYFCMRVVGQSSAPFHCTPIVPHHCCGHSRYCDICTSARSCCILRVLHLYQQVGDHCTCLEDSDQLKSDRITA